VRSHSWPQVTHSQRSGWSSTSVISHIGQAGFVMKSQNNSVPQQNSTAHLVDLIRENGETQLLRFPGHGCYQLNYVTLFSKYAEFQDDEDSTFIHNHAFNSRSGYS